MSQSGTLVSGLTFQSGRALIRKKGSAPDARMAAHCSRRVCRERARWRGEYSVGDTGGNRECEARRARTDEGEHRHGHGEEKSVTVTVTTDDGMPRVIRRTKRRVSVAYVFRAFYESGYTKAQLEYWNYRRGSTLGALEAITADSPKARARSTRAHPNPRAHERVHSVWAQASVL
ncbi:hypothetical protein B0H17DRAFT_1150971 [Mycena rosella]|uniref:Uncharacterized protein n=1 Tax=Mycena rosella TaxID=1033263 RepID=A0AAD7FLB4_MYCRO|nr:hypothetical protein B0H17DRAFT_1150971 [Mycena rosella]